MVSTTTIVAANRSCKHRLKWTGYSFTPFFPGSSGGIQNLNLLTMIRGFYHCANGGSFLPIGLRHPQHGVTNPEYKLLRFRQLPNFFAKRRRH
jgi:hypothetical protein